MSSVVSNTRPTQGSGLGFGVSYINAKVPTQDSRVLGRLSIPGDDEDEEEEEGEEGQSAEEYMKSQQMKLDEEKKALMENHSMVAEEKEKLMSEIQKRHNQLKKQQDAQASLLAKIKVLLSDLFIFTLRACVYIYIRQLSSFMAPTSWFIDLTVATCHIQYTFLSLCQFFFTRKWTKHEKTRSAQCLYDTKVAANGITRKSF